MKIRDSKKARSFASSDLLLFALAGNFTFAPAAYAQSYNAGTNNTITPSTTLVQQILNRDGTEGTLTYPSDGTTTGSQPQGVAVGNDNNGTGGSVVIGSNNNARPGNIPENMTFATAIGNYNTATGAYSTSLGIANLASATSSVALGTANVASGNTAIGIGRQTSAIGNFSIAVGNVAQATGLSAIALGNTSTASADRAIAIGNNDGANVRNGLQTQATAADATALGTGASANGVSSLAFGTGAVVTAGAGFGVAVGARANAGGANATAIGSGTSASSAGDVALGLNANSMGTAAGASSVAIGANAVAGTAGAATGGAVAIGQQSSASGQGSVALGNANSSLGINGVAIGANNLANVGGIVIGAGSTAGLNALALGGRVIAIGADSIAVGSNTAVLADRGLALGPNSTASFTNDVALGSGSVTAATIATTGVTIGGTAYTFAGTAPASTVSIGAPGTERTVTNVAAGQLSATSTDAINGSQLNATNQQVTANTAGIAGNATAIVNLSNGTAGLVRQAGGSPGAGTVTVGAQTGGTLIDVTGTDGTRTITGVTAATLNPTSTGAVNGSQLFATENRLGNIAGGIGGVLGGSFDPATGAYAGPTYTIVGGTTATTVQGAFDDYNTAITNVAAVANRGFDVTSARIGTGTVTGTSVANVAPGAIQTTTAGNNIAITQNGTDLTIATNPDLLADSLTTGGTAINAAGLTIAGGPAVTTTGIDAGNRVIANVAAGAAPTDAVNLGQLQAVGAVADNSVQYDNATRTSTTLGGVASTDGGLTGGTTIANVHQGTLSPTSTEAVNGSQLFATNQNVAAARTSADQANSGLGNVAASLGGNAAYDPATGAFTAPAYVVGGTSYNTVGGAVAAQGSIVSAQGGSLATQLGGGTTYDPASGRLGGGFTVNGTTYADVASAVGQAQTTAALGFTVAANGAASRITPGATLTVAAADANTSVTLDPATSRLTVGIVQNPTFTSVVTGATTIDTSGLTNGATTIGATGLTIAGGPGVTTAGVDAGNKVIANVAAGAAPTDAVNVGQLNAVADTVAAGFVVTTGRTGTGTASGTSLARVTPGSTQTITAGNNIAIIQNGTDLTIATNPDLVAGSLTTGGTTLDTNGIRNGATTVGAGGLTIAGGPGVTTAGIDAGGRTIRNVAAGSIAAGSTDAVNGSQLAATNGSISALTTIVGGGTIGAVQRPGTGDRLNLVAAGATGTAPGAAQTLANVAAGLLAAGSTEAVNGGQLAATNLAVATLGQNAVQYDDAGHTNVTFNNRGAAAVLHNVGAGTASTDAVNVGQLAAGMSGTLAAANNYTDGRINALNFDLQHYKRDANAGTAGALAAAALPQAYEPGKSLVAGGVGTYRGQTAFALGVSRIFDDGHTIMKAAVNRDTRGNTGANAGVGYQF